MFTKTMPNWVPMHGQDGRHAFVSAALNRPIPFAGFRKMARHGKDAFRAAVVVMKGAGQ